MELVLEFETEETFDFDAEQIAFQVAEAVLDAENCPYESLVNVLITDDKGIHEMNMEQRGIDRSTDVLSFPGLDYDTPGDFSLAEEDEMMYFDPDTGLLQLGDIVISIDTCKRQAKEYGHSVKREFAFLVSHSMHHLCGYDHMTPEDAVVMEPKQESILQKLGLDRDVR